jgi:hypothetical protein
MREVLERHQHICDELYQLSLEENKFLVENKRQYGAELLNRKQGLLDRLNQNLDALKQALDDTPGENRSLDELKERTRQRILQIIHLDRENEKLILRYSLQSRAGTAPAGTGAPPPPAPGSVARLYGKVMPPRSA